MAEFIGRIDAGKVVAVETVLSAFTSPFVAPSYNLPIFLFGIYAQETAEAVESLKMFTYLVIGTIPLDIIWLWNHEQGWFMKLLTILILVLKVRDLQDFTWFIPTIMVFATALQTRGSSFSNFSGLRGGDVAGATVWSMPGGFTSGGREGYQTVDEPDIQTPKPLGTSQPAAAPAPQQGTPGAYQNV
ncbi:hypothetical protein DAEQUDRAFT_740828 [Daedalea quercina L-15889]|uniref:Uncharacterized protein n=1 Tax=Daedalea quercina L-15889 TaxID=1314783 RepID=A0A165M1P0_9APHY|nr:hypothetical protein DAEQUDRAFT_740828 [Daedalea quercina L-15889]